MLRVVGVAGCCCLMMLLVIECVSVVGLVVV